jgi:hypothetical protein
MASRNRTEIRMNAHKWYWNPDGKGADHTYPQGLAHREDCPYVAGRGWAFADPHTGRLWDTIPEEVVPAIERAHVCRTCWARHMVDVRASWAAEGVTA